LAYPLTVRGLIKVDESPATLFMMYGILYLYLTSTVNVGGKLMSCVNKTHLNGAYELNTMTNIVQFLTEICTVLTEKNRNTIQSPVSA